MFVTRRAERTAAVFAGQRWEQRFHSRFLYFGPSWLWQLVERSRTAVMIDTTGFLSEPILSKIQVLSAIPIRYDTWCRNSSCGLNLKRSDVMTNTRRQPRSAVWQTVIQNYVKVKTVKNKPIKINPCLVIKYYRMKLLLFDDTHVNLLQLCYQSFLQSMISRRREANTSPSWTHEFTVLLILMNLSDSNSDRRIISVQIWFDSLHMLIQMFPLERGRAQYSF